MAAKDIAMVTGASSGIGKVYARRLAARGFDLILVGRDTTKLQQLSDDLLRDYGAKCDVQAADLAERTQSILVEDLLRSDTAITILVNCAGLVSGGPLGDADIGALAAMLEVNVSALSRLCAAAAHNFGMRGRGTIVNLSSATAFIDSPSAGAYAASKAFVLHLTLALDLELKSKGVQVQAVLPGYTATPMLGNSHGISEHMLMDVDTLVDAALSGLDQGELVTIPSLEDAALFGNWMGSRTAMKPGLSKNVAATRYRAVSAGLMRS